MNARTPKQVLLVRCGARLCAFPVADVVETLRPVPVSPFAGTASFVAGAAVVRGEPVPVVDLGSFVGDTADAAPGRFVVVRCGSRRAVLAVQAVVGVTQLPDTDAESAPLLDSACAGAIEALAASDRELLVVLRAARIVPEDAWHPVEPECRP